MARILEITPATLRDALRKAKQQGRDEVLAGLKAVAKLNGSASAVMTTVYKAEPGPAPPPTPDTDADDLHQSLYEALLESLIEARESGDDEKAAGLVQAYRDHLDDPQQLAAALQDTGEPEEIAKSLGRLLLKAGKWDSSQGADAVKSLAAEMAAEMGAFS